MVGGGAWCEAVVVVVLVSADVLFRHAHSQAKHCDYCDCSPLPSPTAYFSAVCPPVHSVLVVCCVDGFVGYLIQLWAFIVVARH